MRPKHDICVAHTSYLKHCHVATVAVVLENESHGTLDIRSVVCTNNDGRPPASADCKRVHDLGCKIEVALRTSDWRIGPFPCSRAK